MLFEREAVRPSVQNIVWGTRQGLIQWNKYVWLLFLHILPVSNLNHTENVA